ncbi:Flp1 family type IVb pilin [Halalkalibacter alkaliphilus]|uniref:Putative Flagellin Flp1-like domain-containing protein n=1 Tax=Halalkalibacter alkaliphilus TaxID=2917993 RepID=A0A9X2I4T4_9BACI|nr:Flp1 family type IVb pilin [Halalkalibacter alkaliphilus]MCL7748012.1 hypothetical protein [Halalkalibacter alkaliphilus]
MKKAKTFLTKLWKDEEGLGTLEILLIVAVLVGVALLFGNTIAEWVQNILGGINPDPVDVPGSVD